MVQSKTGGLPELSDLVSVGFWVGFLMISRPCLGEAGATLSQARLPRTWRWRFAWGRFTGELGHGEKGRKQELGCSATEVQVPQGSAEVGVDFKVISD